MLNRPRPSSLRKPIRVMVVDDSSIIRNMVVKALKEDSGIQVAATAINGEFAVQQITKQEIDIVLLDIEMPVMNGMQALPQLLKASPATKVIMNSSLTLKGAGISLEALSKGASDYIAKPSSTGGTSELDSFFRELKQKVKALGATVSHKPKEVKPVQSVATASTRLAQVKQKGTMPIVPPRALAFASSTGGPQALLKVFAELKGHLTSVPIFITQHMPAKFTTILAKNISDAVGREAVEAEDGMSVLPGKIYVAPGDYHMIIKRQGASTVIKLNQEPPVNFCRPSADPMIESLVEVYGSKLLLTVLTGMGSDGLGGAKALNAQGGYVVTQDEASCVVWGMPRAVSENNLSQADLSLGMIPSYLIKAFGG